MNLAILILAQLALAQHYCLKRVKEELEFNSNSCITAHNNARGNFGVPLARWNSRLAQQAQSYANYLDSVGQMVHSSLGSRGGAGENLYQSGGRASCERAVGSWVAENYLNEVLTDRVISSKGHHSQIVWSSSREIGCGTSGGTVVCRYSNSQVKHRKAK